MPCHKALKVLIFQLSRDGNRTSYVHCFDETVWEGVASDGCDERFCNSLSRDFLSSKAVSLNDRVFGCKLLNNTNTMQDSAQTNPFKFECLVLDWSSCRPDKTTKCHDGKDPTDNAVEKTSSTHQRPLDPRKRVPLPRQEGKNVWRQF